MMGLLEWFAVGGVLGIVAAGLPYWLTQRSGEAEAMARRVELALVKLQLDQEVLSQRVDYVLDLLAGAPKDGGR